MRGTCLMILLACAAAAHAQSVQRALVYRSAGGRELRIDVHLPANGGRSRPAVICVHGGGWRSGERRQMGEKAASLARQGFVGATIDYRSSDEAVFPGAVDDTRAAVRWMRANAARFGVDAARIGLFGSSAGGHLALMVGCTDPSHPVAAVASWNGPADLVRGFTEGGHVSKYARDATERFLGGPYASHRVLYDRASPARRIVPGAPPLFLAHGDEDGTVPASQGDFMAQAARRLGVPVTLVPVARGGHIFDQGGDPPESELWDRTVAFFRRTLGR